MTNMEVLNWNRNCFLWEETDLFESHYNTKNQVKKILELFYYDVTHFNHEQSHEYFLEFIPYLYEAHGFSLQEQRETYQKLQEIHFHIKGLISQKSNFILGQIPKENYTLLKKLLGKIELLSYSLCCSFDPNCYEQKYEFFRALIFSIKNLEVLRNILEKTPHYVNFMDRKCMALAEEIVTIYLEKLKLHCFDETHLEELLYYDRVLEMILFHEPNYLDVHNARKLDNLFKKEWNNNKEISEKNDRYGYFIFKWRNFFESLFQKEMKKEPFYPYSKELLSYEFMVYKDFPYGVNKEAEWIYKEHGQIEKKKEYPIIYTIDGDDTKELDDGFSCQKNDGTYLLGIHVSNPIFMLKDSTLVWKEAQKRTTSIYGNTFFAPMFPHILAEQCFSLNEKTVKNVLSMYFTIDLERKEILKKELKMEPVYIAKNDTYKKCNQTLKQNAKNTEYEKTLSYIETLLPFLKSHYQIDPTYALLNRKELNVSFTNIIGKTKSENIIETLMIFANMEMAKLAEEKSIPFLYRNHKMTSMYEEDLKRFKNILEQVKNNQPYLNEINVLLAHYPKSYYGTVNEGHYGLGVSHYTHITSADRRLADCYNIKMLEMFYFKNQSKIELEKQKEELEKIAQMINERNNTLHLFQKELGRNHTYMLLLSKNNNKKQVF